MMPAVSSPELKKRYQKVERNWGEKHEFDWPPPPPENAKAIRERLDAINDFFDGHVSACWECGRLCLRADMQQQEIGAGCCITAMMNICGRCYEWEQSDRRGACVDCGREEYSVDCVRGDDGRLLPICIDCNRKRDEGEAK